MNNGVFRPIETGVNMGHTGVSRSVVDQRRQKVDPTDEDRALVLAANLEADKIAAKPSSTEPVLTPRVRMLVR